MLLTMAKNLGETGKKLEIVFDIVEPNFDPVEPDKFLKKCLTKATVRIYPKVASGGAVLPDGSGLA